MERLSSLLLKRTVGLFLFESFNLGGVGLCVDGNVKHLGFWNQRFWVEGIKETPQEAITEHLKEEEDDDEIYVVNYFNYYIITASRSIVAQLTNFYLKS